MKKLLLITPLLIAACSSNPHKAEELDTKIEKSQNVGSDAVIGIKDGNMIYQKKVLLSEEIRTATITAREQEAKLYGGPRYFDNNGLIGALRDCRSKVAAISGDKLQWTEKREYVIPDEDNIKMGLDEQGNLAGINEEFLKDRLARFKEYQKVLMQRTEEMENKIAACNAEVGLSKKKAEATKEP
jgi:hypothetical protein